MGKINLKTKKITEHSTELQKECVATLDDNRAYIVHYFEIEILERLDYVTETEAWTEVDKKKISELKSKISDAIAKVVADELKNNTNTGLMKLVSGVKDFKTEARTCMSIEKAFGKFNSSRFEDLRKILDR